MTNLWFLGASASLCAIGALHSIVGERLLMRSVLARLPAGGHLPLTFEKQTLRFAWHLTTIAWWAFAALPAAAAFTPIDQGARVGLVALAALLVVSSLVIAVASKGAHFAWPVFAIGAGLLGVGLEGPAWVHGSGVAGGAARAAAAFTGAIAAIHAWWALAPGARGRGGDGSGSVVIPATAAGRAVFRPGRGATLLVAVALALTGAAALHVTGTVDAPWPAWLSRVATAGASIVFLARTVGELRYVGLFKRVVGTPFARWDTRLYTPVSFTLSVLLALALLLRHDLDAWAHRRTERATTSVHPSV